MDRPNGSESGPSQPDKTAVQGRPDVEFGIYSHRTYEPDEKPRRNMTLIIGAAIVLTGLVIGLGAYLLLRDRESNPSLSERQITKVPAASEVLPSMESVSRTEDPTEAQQPTDAKEITTSQGVLRIEQARLTNEFTECPEGGGRCEESRGNKYILIITLKSTEGRNTQEFHDQVAVEAFSSYIRTSDGQILNVKQVGGVPPNSSTQITFSYLYSSNSQGLIFHWPGNAPIRLQTAG